jgi:hypothetical protein
MGALVPSFNFTDLVEVAPALVELKVNEVELMLSTGRAPVPFKVTVSDPALVGTLSVPVSLPAAGGAKLKPTVQCFPASMVLMEQVSFSIAKPVPESAIRLTMTGLVLELVNVKVLFAAGAPTVTEPNETVAGECAKGGGLASAGRAAKSPQSSRTAAIAVTRCREVSQQRTTARADAEHSLVLALIFDRFIQITIGELRYHRVLWDVREIVNWPNGATFAGRSRCDVQAQSPRTTPPARRSF